MIKILKALGILFGILLVLFILFISIITIIFYEPDCPRNLSKTQCISEIKKSIGITLDDNITILFAEDTHSSLLGDGDTYIKIKLSDIQLKNIIADIQTDKAWGKLTQSNKLPEIANIFPDDYPIKLTNGYYYLRDFQLEWYPEKINLNVSMWNRHSYNFASAILDFNSRILFVFNSDN